MGKLKSFFSLFQHSVLLLVFLFSDFYFFVLFQIPPFQLCPFLQLGLCHIVLSPSVLPERRGLFLLPFLCTPGSEGLWGQGDEEAMLGGPEGVAF